MENWKVQYIAAIAVFIMELITVEYLDPQIQRIVVVALCGLTAILIVALWPEKKSSGPQIEVLTKREYDALPVKDKDTLYFTTGEDEEVS